MTENISVNCDPELKLIAGKAADDEGFNLSEYVVKVLAEHLGRPDLVIVPRKKIGRPRKEIVLNGK